MIPRSYSTKAGRVVGYKLFICYRRVDKDFARAIERVLGEHFGADSVFLDTDEIKGGQQWKHKVIDVLQDKPIVVTLITTHWTVRQGKRRLLDKEDHVRFELESALEHGLLVVPVLYDPRTGPSPSTFRRRSMPYWSSRKFRSAATAGRIHSGVPATALLDLGVAPVARAKPQSAIRATPTADARRVRPTTRSVVPSHVHG